ncbi:hypothetical protein CSUB01_08373 [Colletotrichum sublineola]|uniref:RTA1 domain-containing protein n=1 Tax=Colletotrichum sublineola TaxID=1173701 RepID=A0A066X4K9_COLSU|nr:hypothetical protein CSUB01_08373 [Colletotrichum sublineola]
MATPFQVEAWSEYAIGLLVLLIRLVYRTTIVGTNWEGDDYFAFIAVFFWTGELVMLELIGENTLAPPFLTVVNVLPRT